MDQPFATRAMVGIFQQLLRIVANGLQGSLYGRIDLANVEALPRLDTDLRHLCNDRLISEMRRLNLEQFSGIGKEVARWHAIHLELRRGLHVHGRVGFECDWLERFAPLG